MGIHRERVTGTQIPPVSLDFSASYTVINSPELRGALLYGKVSLHKKFPEL